ncbi:MAG TPA: lysyl oxidase family protein [Candidatus Binatia bacterium]|jgi:hypothetical protein|nr:lysyl oxidase family protein [Candidatus Binatia bacterium]
MRNDRSNAGSWKLILLIVLFVGLVAAKSWALLEQRRDDTAPGAAKEPALVETTVKGRLELDLSDAGTHLPAVLAAATANDEATRKSLEELARRQVFTSYLQTIFREPAMPLPSDHMTLALGERTFDASRKRLVIPYTLSGYIVAPSDTLEESLPDLAETDAQTAETFIVPADPRHLFQRLGFACANQDEIPLGQVDDANYGNYFDPKCAPGVTDCEDPSGKPLEPCLDVLNRENGVAALSVSLKRVAYDADLAAKWTAGPPTTKGGADLTVDKEKLAEYDIIYKDFAPDSCAIAEKCVGGPGRRRLLRFRAVTPNIGDTDIAFGDVKQLVDKTHQFVWSDCHKHYHFNGYGTFQLEKDGKAVLPGTKQSFCVESTGRARNAADAAFTAPYQKCENQGITAGWEDEYFAGLDCQWIDITDLKMDAPQQTYQLSMEVNPLKLLCEGVPTPGKYVAATDEQGLPVIGPGGEPALKQACKVDPKVYENNKVTVDVTVPKTGSVVTMPCAVEDFGPLRNCGWTMAAPLTCAPGRPWRAGGSGEVVRICAGDTPCAHEEALAEASASWTAFTCPASGKYVTLTGPYLAR